VQTFSNSQLMRRKVQLGIAACPNSPEPPCSDRLSESCYAQYSYHWNLRHFVISCLLELVLACPKIKDQLCLQFQLSHFNLLSLYLSHFRYPGSNWRSDDDHRFADFYKPPCSGLAGTHMDHRMPTSYFDLQDTESNDFCVKSNESLRLSIGHFCVLRTGTRCLPSRCKRITSPVKRPG
jgi:hypothetical protein